MINEKETKKTTEQINKTKSCFFAKIWQNRLDLLRKKKENADINKIRNKRRNYNRYHRITVGYKRILQKAICQQIGQPRRNG